MTSTFIRSELTTAESVLLRQTGMSTKPYWRPPYGSTNQFVQDQATAVGYPKTVMWARDTIDWDPATTTAQIVARTTSPLPTSGSIVLAHLGGFRTPDALPEIIRVLRANGYTMTTVSDMRDG
jgi:peptidoglycan/xylan/chitin deacetylase (PgdA/CDA1 family)